LRTPAEKRDIFTTNHPNGREENLGCNIEIKEGITQRRRPAGKPPDAEKKNTLFPTQARGREENYNRDSE